MLKYSLYIVIIIFVCNAFQCVCVVLYISFLCEIGTNIVIKRNNALGKYEKRYFLYCKRLHKN